MRFRSVLSTLVILGAAAMSAATSSAQGPAAPPAFDGKYVGTARQTTSSPRGDCWPITSVEMTVTGPQVVMSENHLNGAFTYRGSVNGAGEVSAVYESKAARPEAYPGDYYIYGTIHDKVFTGERRHGSGGRASCSFRVELTKQ
jgi:hypothetical protein